MVLHSNRFTINWYDLLLFGLYLAKLTKRLDFLLKFEDETFPAKSFSFPSRFSNH
jgi:hypothetical protein